MDKFLTFLGEAWPPSKNGPPQGKQKTPFGNSAGPKKSKPSFGDQGTPAKGLTLQHPAGPAKKSPFGPKSSSNDGDDKPPFGQTEPDEDAGPNGAFGQQQAPMDKESMLAMQEIEQQKAEEEAALARQKAEKEAIERQKVKNMRAQADADVLAALEDKFNPETDVVEFYPDMLTFTQYDDEQKEKAAKLRGKNPMTGDGASPGPPGSAEPNVGDQGETPKLPDASKTKSDLKKKKIQSTEVDDAESLSQPPVSDDEEEDGDEFADEEENEDEEAREEGEGEDERAAEENEEEGDEHQVEKNPMKEKELAASPNNRMMGQGERKIFKIKPADHVSGNKFVGQDQFDDEMGDEEDEGAGEGVESEAEPRPSSERLVGKEKKESFAEKGKKLKKNKAKDPNIKKFSESGWQGQ
jgi:hypothetical protein